MPLNTVYSSLSHEQYVGIHFIVNDLSFLDFNIDVLLNDWSVYYLQVCFIPPDTTALKTQKDRANVRLLQKQDKGMEI